MLPRASPGELPLLRDGGFIMTQTMAKVSIYMYSGHMCMPCCFIVVSLGIDSI